MKTRKLTVNYTPLRIAASIEVVGSVPTQQTYSYGSDEYSPDYTLTPLVLLPVCMAIDPDDVMADGQINTSLYDIRWIEDIQGVQTEITSSNANYAIETEGDSKGQISVKRNVSVGLPITLRFFAKFLDTRTGQVFEYNLSRVVKCTEMVDAFAELSIDSPATLEWNPIRQDAQQTIVAKVISVNEDITNTEKCNIFWFKQTNNGSTYSLTELTTEDIEVVSLSKDTLVINRDHIGDEVTYHVRATYDAAGSPRAIDALYDSDPIAITTIHRRVPPFEYDWKGVPQEVSKDTSEINPTAVVWDNAGIIEDANKHFNINWYRKLSGATSYTKVTNSVSPAIPFAEGMMLGLEVTDKGNYKMITDGDYMIVDSDGSVVIDK